MSETPDRTMSDEPTAITESFNRSHENPVRYCVVREVFDEGEWVVTEDTVSVTVVGTETVGETGVIYFFDPTNDVNLIVSVERFITARTEGVN